MRYLTWKLSVFVVSATVLGACGGKTGTGPSPQPQPQPTVTSIVVSGSNSVNVGSTSMMTASARRSDGTAQDATNTAVWQSSNIAVATVSAGGRVSAMAPGTTVISAAFSGQTGQITLEVMSIDNVQRVTIRLTSFVVDGTCDGNSIFEDTVDGEFFWALELQRDGGTTTIQSTEATYTKGTHALTRTTTFNRNVTRGDDFRVRFEAYERDGLLGNDPRLNGHSSSQTYTYVGGRWTPNSRSFSLGPGGSCGVKINYTISSVAQ